MDEKLRGKSILVGRDALQNSLLVAVEGTGTATVAGTLGVPASVSRCKPSEGMAHCKISVSQSGALVVTNMKSANVTCVDGVEVASKHIDEKSTLQLGKDRYSVSVAAILQTATEVVNGCARRAATVGERMRNTPQTTVGGMVAGQAGAAPAAKPVAAAAQTGAASIAHLKRVWDNYHDEEIKIRKQQKEIGLLSSVPMIFTLGSGSLAAIAKASNWSDSIFTVTMVMSVVGFLLMLYGFYRRYNDKSIEEIEELKEKFESEYVCPKCRHFLGYKRFTLLQQDKSCVYCKTPFSS